MALRLHKYVMGVCICMYAVAHMCVCASVCNLSMYMYTCGVAYIQEEKMFVSTCICMPKMCTYVGVHIYARTCV